MKSYEVEFQDFCKSMWFENVVEHSDWKEDPQDFDEYVRLNKGWLKTQHAEHKIEKMRRRGTWT
jgi:hypothetical protein